LGGKIQNKLKTERICSFLSKKNKGISQGLSLYFINVARIAVTAD
jgi:hypothetical protein